ncbi:MAG: DUF4082 domain-containing protein, partial [Acidobacteria bacterium]|nr:DUF4082 domain-containing protein [Acidobacteriota bacterium]
MTMTALPTPIPLWDITSNMAAPSLVSSGFVIDAASEKAGLVMEAPKTGNISKIGFYLPTVTTGATLDARLESVSSTTGLPSASLFAANTDGTVVSVTATPAWLEATLTAAAAVTKGERIALVVAQPAAGSGSCAVGNIANWWGSGNAHGIPFGANYVASWAASSGFRCPLIFPVYDDNTYGYCPQNMPITAINLAYTWNSSSTPDEVGNRFDLVVPTRIVGARLFFNPAGDGRDFTLRLYDSGGTQLATRTFDSAQYANSTYLWADLLFTSPVDCSAGVHRMTILPTTVSNNGTGHITIPSATGARYAMPGGVDTYWTERTDAGAFSDTNTRMMLMTPLVQGFDNAAGGGGGDTGGLRRF